MTPLIEARSVSAGYGGQPVVHDLDLTVGPGEVVCLLGPNGAGKTTTLLALSGELPLLGGEVLFEGEPTTAPLYRRARAGLAYVTEERSVFKSLSGLDNLRCGGVASSDVLALFPELERCLGTRGGLLSGGEQQMLTVGRALARKPRLLLADELSLGLGPLIVDRLLQAVRAAATDRGMAVLLVEQHARKALRYADRVYVMRRGHVEMALTADEAGRRISEIENVYLAISAAGTPGPGANNRPSRGGSMGLETPEETA
jgi:branched-chain amino acid transport system ATP-binding protein